VKINYANLPDESSIQPTTLDITRYASLPSVTWKLGPYFNIFVRMNEFSISTNTGNTPGKTMFVHAEIASSFTRTAEIDIDVYDNRGSELTVSLSSLELRPLQKNHRS